MAHNPATGGNFSSLGGWQNQISVGNEPTAKQVADVKNLMPFFGEPTRDRINNMTRWRSYEKENSDYPEAFRQMYGDPTGQGAMMPNGHVSKVILEKTLASQCYELSIMAPWFLWEGSIDLSWSVDYFNKHMLDRSPEESLPRLLSNSRRQGFASMVRYGIALLLEATFAETPMGRFTYMMNIEQIKVATVETASYGAIVSILEHTPWDVVRGVDNDEGKQYTISELNGIFRSECDAFGLVHKSLGGAELAINRIHQELMNRAGNSGGTLLTVLPTGMAQYIKESKLTSRAFYMTGPGAGGDGDIAKALDSSSTVVEARSYTQGTHSEGHNPFFRPKTIGNYITMDDGGVDYRSFNPVDPSCYRTSKLDTWTYGGEDLDRYVLLRYSDMMQYSGLWNFGVPQSPLTDSIGRGFMHDVGCYTWGQLIHKDGGMENVLRALQEMPAEKRAAFKQSLQLIKKKEDGSLDPRVNFVDGAKFPGQYATSHQFDIDLFDGMLNSHSGIEWDESFSVGELQEYERRRAMGVRDYTTLSSRAKAAESKFGAQKRSRSQFHEDDHKSISLQFEEGRPDSSDSDMDDDDEDGTPVYINRGTHVGRQIIGRTVFRKKKNQFAGPPVSTETSEMNRLRLAILALADTCAQKANGGVAPETNPEIILKCLGVLTEFTEMIMRGLPGKPTDDTKLVLMREVHRVAENEIRRVINEEKDVDKKAIRPEQLRHRLMAGITPLMSELQTRMVLNHLPASLSAPFENAKRTNPSADLSDVSNEEAKQGWWFSQPFTQTELSKKTDAEAARKTADEKHKEYDDDMDPLRQALDKAKQDMASAQASITAASTPAALNHLNALAPGAAPTLQAAIDLQTYRDNYDIHVGEFATAQDDVNDQLLKWRAVEKLILAAEKAEKAYHEARRARIDSAMEQGIENGNIRLMVLPQGSGWEHATKLPHDAFASTLTARHTVLFNLSEDQQKCLDQTKGLPTFARALSADRMDAFCWSLALSRIYWKIQAHREKQRNEKVWGVPGSRVIWGLLSPKDKDANTPSPNTATASILAPLPADILHSSIWDDEMFKRLMRFAKSSFDPTKVTAANPSGCRDVLPSQTLLSHVIRALECMLAQRILTNPGAADFQARLASVPGGENTLYKDGVYDDAQPAFNDPEKSANLLRDSLLNGYKTDAKAAPLPAMVQERRKECLLVFFTITDLVDNANRWELDPAHKTHSQIGLYRAVDALLEDVFGSETVRPSQFQLAYNLLKKTIENRLTKDLAAEPPEVLAAAKIHLDDAFKKLAAFCTDRYKEDKALRKKEKQQTPLLGDADGLSNDWSKETIEDLLMHATLASGEVVQFFMANNIPMSLYLRLWRPSGTYRMGQLLHMYAGPGGAALTYYQRPHFMTSDNAGQKMVFGHYTIYTKTIVKDPQRIVIMRNIFCNKYMGGNDATIWDPLDPDHLRAFASKKMEQSIFVTAGLMSKAENNRSIFLSFTGEMPSTIPCSAEVANHVRYEGCSAVAKHWGYNTNGFSYRSNDPYRCAANINERAYNVICMQYYQAQWSDETNSFSRTTLNTGHWGKDAPCPGNAAVLRGARLVFDPPEYSQTRVNRLV
jgi:hypothetical protein